MAHACERQGVDITSIFVFLSYLAVCIISFFAVISLYGSDGFVVPSLNVLSLVSFIYFLFLCLMGLTNKQYYFLVFPFLVLTVPNAVNDLLPNFLMGPVWERNSSAFSFFTHIDLYLFFGVLRFYRDVNVRHKPVVLLVSVCFILFFSTHLLIGINSDYLGPFLFGLYQIRYFMLLFLVVSFFNIQRDFKYFFWGVCLAAVFLVFESLATTYLRGGGVDARLGSGNFAVNVYGNLLAALTMFLYFGRGLLPVRLLNTLFIYGCMFVLVCAMFMTGTKGSLFSMFVSFVLLWRFAGVKSKSGFVLFYSLAGLAFLFGLYLSYLYINHLVSIGVFSDGYVYDEGTSSLRTRVVLWGVTADMIKDNLYLGIGNGVWNYIKYDYGSPFDVLLDPHNDYLSYIVNYGVTALAIVFFFYLFPLYKVVFLKRSTYGYIVFVSFVVPLAISSFANANTLKHQVFALFGFFLLCLYRFHQQPQFGEDATGRIVLVPKPGNRNADL